MRFQDKGPNAKKKTLLALAVIEMCCAVLFVINTALELMVALQIYLDVCVAAFSGARWIF